MIWLPYPSYPASVITLRTEELTETHDDLMLMAKAYRGLSVAPKNGAEFQNWMNLYHEHQDSFFTLGLYVCVELRHRPNPGVTARHQKTWAKYWEEKRKFRKYINHPDWPEDFHTSMRDALLQRDWDHYAEMFRASDEPFGEVPIQWPQR